MASASVEETTTGGRGNATSTVDDRNSSPNGYYSSKDQVSEVGKLGDVEVSDGVIWTLLAPLVLLVVMVVVGAVAFGLWRYKDRRCGPKGGETARDEEEEAGGRLQLQPLPPGEPEPDPSTGRHPHHHQHHHHHPCPGFQPQSEHQLLHPYAAQIMHRHVQQPDATGCSSAASRLSGRRTGWEGKEAARPTGSSPQSRDHGQENSVVLNSTASGTGTGRSSQGQAVYRRRCRPRALGVSVEDVVEEVHRAASVGLAGGEMWVDGGGWAAAEVKVAGGARGQGGQTYCTCCSACRLHCGSVPARPGHHGQPFDAGGGCCCCSPCGPDPCMHARHEGGRLLWSGHADHVHGHALRPAQARDSYPQLLPSQCPHQDHYHHHHQLHRHHQHHRVHQENQLPNDQFYDIRDHPSSHAHSLPAPQRHVPLQRPFADFGDGRWVARVRRQETNASLRELKRNREVVSRESPMSQSGTVEVAQESQGSMATACQQCHTTAYSQPRLCRHKHGYYVNRAVDVDEEQMADTGKNGWDVACEQQTHFICEDLPIHPPQLPCHFPSPCSRPPHHDHPPLHPHTNHRHPSDGPHPGQLRSGDWQQGGVENPVFVSDMEMARASEESLLDSDSLARRSAPGVGDGSPSTRADDPRGLYLYHRRKRTPQIINSTSMQSSLTDDELSGISRRERLPSRPLPPILPKPALGEGPDVSSIKMMSSNSQAWRMSHRLLPADLSSATPSSDPTPASECGYRGTESSGSELKDETLSLPSSISRFHASRVQFPPPALDTPYPLSSTKAVYSMHHTADSGSVSGYPRPGSPSPGSLVIELLERFSDNTSLLPNVGSSVTSGQLSDVSRPSDAGSCQPPSTARPTSVSPGPDAGGGSSRRGGPARPSGTERGGPAARGRVSFHLAPAAEARHRDYRDLPAREVDLAESAEASASSGLKGGRSFSQAERPAHSEEGRADDKEVEADDRYLFHGDREPAPRHAPKADLVVCAVVQDTKDNFPLLAWEPPDAASLAGSTRVCLSKTTIRVDPPLAVTSPDLPASAAQFRLGASHKGPDYVHHSEITRRPGLTPDSNFPPATTKLPPATPRFPPAIMKPLPGVARASDQRKSSDYKYTRVPNQDNLQGQDEEDDDDDEVFLTSAAPPDSGRAVPPAIPTTPRTPLLAKQDEDKDEDEDERRTTAGMRRLIVPFRRRPSSRGRAQTPFRPSLRGNTEHIEPSNLIPSTTVNTAMASSHHPSPSAYTKSCGIRPSAQTAADRITSSTQASHAQQDRNTPSPPPPAPLDSSSPSPVNPAAAQGGLPCSSASSRHADYAPGSPSAGSAPSLPPLPETKPPGGFRHPASSSQDDQASRTLRKGHTQKQPPATFDKARLLPLPRPFWERSGRQESENRLLPQQLTAHGFYDQRQQSRGRGQSQQQGQPGDTTEQRSPSDQRDQKQLGQGRPPPPASEPRRATAASEAPDRQPAAGQQPQQETQPTLARTDWEILAEVMHSFPKAAAAPRKHAAKAAARSGETDSSGNNNTACAAETRACSHGDDNQEDSGDDSGSSVWSMIFPDLSMPTSFADELFGIWSLSPELDSKDVSPSQPRRPLMTPLKEEEREANSRFIWGSHSGSLFVPARAAGELRPRVLAFPARPGSSSKQDDGVGSEEPERKGSEEEQEGVEEFAEEEDGYEDDGFSGLEGLTTSSDADHYGLLGQGRRPSPPRPPPAELADSPEQIMSLTTSSTRSASDPAAGPTRLASCPGGFGGSGDVLQGPAIPEGSRCLYPLGDDAADEYDDYCPLTLNNANLSHLYVISGDPDADGSDVEPDSLNNNNNNNNDDDDDDNYNGPSSATVPRATLQVPGGVTAKAVSSRNNPDCSSLRQDSVPSVLAIVLDKQQPWL